MLNPPIWEAEEKEAVRNPQIGIDTVLGFDRFFRILLPNQLIFQASKMRRKDREGWGPSSSVSFLGGSGAREMSELSSCSIFASRKWRSVFPIARSAFRRARHGQGGILSMPTYVLLGSHYFPALFLSWPPTFIPFSSVSDSLPPWP